MTGPRWSFLRAEKVGHWRTAGIIMILALTVRLTIATLMHQPGYTDAYYYAVGARQLYAGEGFNLPFVWNYLDPPRTIPHPGYLYWMPLTSILGWLGMLILGGSFLAMQAPFVLSSALLALVAYGITWDLTGKQKHAMLAGLLVVFPGFYSHVLVLPDNFAPFALAGSLCLWAAGRGLRDGRALWFGLAGLAAGFGHLARADGALLVLVTLLAALAQLLPSHAHGKAPRRRWGRVVSSLLLVVLGYLLVMGAWFARNWSVAGTPLAGAGFSTMFLTNYDDLFAYGSPLTLRSYLAWGWDNILASKFQGLLVNLQRLWVEGLMVFLLPFTGLGLWRMRRDRLLWPFFGYVPLLFLLMTLVFTFPGMRGGLFHSGSVLLPFFFAAAGPGLESAVQWIARTRRNWHPSSAWRLFAAGLVGFAIVVTSFALCRAGVLSGAWNARDQGYGEIGQWLDAQGKRDAVVMVGDAPGFTWHTGHAAVAVPNEPWEIILVAAELYGASYLVLDDTRPRTADAVYSGRLAVPRLALQRAAGSGGTEWQVYEIRK